LEAAFASATVRLAAFAAAALGFFFTTWAGRAACGRAGACLRVTTGTAPALRWVPADAADIFMPNLQA
jgi:hypothetical protein